MKIQRVEGKPVLTGISVPTDNGTKLRTLVLDPKKSVFNVDAITGDAMLTHPFGAFEVVADSKDKHKKGKPGGRRAGEPPQIGNELIEDEEDYLALVRDVAAVKDFDERSELIGKLNAAAIHVRPADFISVEDQLAWDRKRRNAGPDATDADTLKATEEVKTDEEMENDAADRAANTVDEEPDEPTADKKGEEK